MTFQNVLKKNIFYQINLPMQTAWEKQSACQRVKNKNVFADDAGRKWAIIQIQTLIQRVYSQLPGYLVLRTTSTLHITIHTSVINTNNRDVKNCHPFELSCAPNVVGALGHFDSYPLAVWGATRIMLPSIFILRQVAPL